MSTNKPFSVLFVCMGNICRSPAAEGVFAHFVSNMQNPMDVFVDSAGTIGFHTGHSPDSRMQSAARARGYSLTSRARKVTKLDLAKFDLILAMDRENLADLQQMADRDELEKIKLFGNFIPGEHCPDVPDPYYGGNDGFETVLDMIESACPSILEDLWKQYQPG
jgi:protein-tyrosine phosphatase